MGENRLMSRRGDFYTTQGHILSKSVIMRFGTQPASEIEVRESAKARKTAFQHDIWKVTNETSRQCKWVALPDPASITVGRQHGTRSSEHRKE